MLGWHKLWAWCHFGNRMKQCMCLDSWSVEGFWAEHTYELFGCSTPRRGISQLLLQNISVLLSFVYREPPCGWCHCKLIEPVVLECCAICQCQVDTTPSQINALVPGFQGPPAADYLSESISIHEINVLFNMNVWLNVPNGIPGWVLIFLSWLIRVLWRTQHLLRCLLESRKPVVDFESKSHQGGWRNALEFAFHGWERHQASQVG